MRLRRRAEERRKTRLPPAVRRLPLGRSPDRRAGWVEARRDGPAATPKTRRERRGGSRREARATARDGACGACVGERGVGAAGPSVTQAGLAPAGWTLCNDSTGD